MSIPPTLLQRIASGDAEAVPRLLDSYGGLIWSIVRKQVASADAQDLVQEVMIQLWERAQSFDPERGSEAAFITTVARRRLIDFRRKQGRRGDNVELPEEVPHEEDSFEQFELADEARVATQALDQLRPEQREVLQLALVEGRTHVQIAEQTGLPLGTVKSHARRGLDRVRKLLEVGSAGAQEGEDS